MQDSLLEMQGYVYLKHKLSGGSILSATIPAVTEEKHNFIIIIIFLKYILLQETEKLGPRT